MKHTFELNGGENFKDIEKSILTVLDTKARLDGIEIKIENEVNDKEVVIDYDSEQFKDEIIDELKINSNKIVFEKTLRVDLLNVLYLKNIEFKNNSKIVANKFNIDDISFEALVELLTHLEISKKDFSFDYHRIFNIVSGKTDKLDFSKINEYLDEYKFHLEIEEEFIKEHKKVKIENLKTKQNFFIQNSTTDSFDLIIENCNEISIQFTLNNLWIKDLIIKNVSSVFLKSNTLEFDKKRIENVQFENVKNIKIDSLLLNPNMKIEKIKNCGIFEIDFNNFSFKKVNTFLTTNKDMLKNFESISIPVSPYIDFIEFKKHSENLTLYFDYSEFFNIMNPSFEKIDDNYTKNILNETFEKFLEQFISFNDSKKIFFVFPNLKTIEERLKLLFESIRKSNDKIIVKSSDGKNLNLFLNFVKMKKSMSI